ncbi:hypothetical protein P3454_26360, partial [Vibrio parahaemolyticus]|nr:hypothetical protein [Vibrio parahaemolyticus]
NDSNLIHSNTSFKVDRNRLKLTKTVLVHPSTVPAITNSGLVEKNSSFTQLDVKMCGLYTF